MSRSGNWYDNMPTESFCGTLKQELVYQRRFRTRAEARAAIQEYIEVFYNRTRRHTALGNLAPTATRDRNRRTADRVPHLRSGKCGILEEEENHG